MAEWNRLRLVNARIRDIGRALQFHEEPAEHSDDEHGSEDGSSRECVSAAMKDLHRFRLSASEEVELAPQGLRLQDRQSQINVMPGTKTRDYSSKVA